jgi:peptide/nickel transport system ATP-binding protein
MSTETHKKGALLQIRDLWIEGQSVDLWTPIVRGISLEVHRGEVLGLIGESGAGKSTIGLAAIGFVRPGCRITAGSVQFSGVDLLKLDERRRRELRGERMAYVAQSAAASFNPAHRLIDQTIESAVTQGLKKRAEAQAQATRLYEQLRLPDPSHIGRRYPHQVSGGQLQRVMTAMAMSCRPELIVFDEPTTALDVTTQIEVLAAIRDIVRQSQVAAIYITHDLSVVAQMADRIKVLLRGAEVEEADTRTMLTAPSQEYTRTLWAVRGHVHPEPPPPTNSTPLLSLRNVTAAYGLVPVIKSISFDVARGRTVAVVGESGSGKSTTARAITGLLRPSAGEIRFDGHALPRDYRQRARNELRQIQMIYQSADTALNPKHRVREIVGRPAAFYRGLRGKALTERVRELLVMIELEPDRVIDRLPSELSGGQKQRIGIARALAAEPRLLICDEVTSALDQLVAEEILKLLDRLQRELDLSYMFITHDLATVRSIADEVIVMKDGEVVEQGPKTEMFHPPHHPYTELLISSVPEMDPDWLDRLLTERTAHAASKNAA